jgi:hypothetical protein
VLRPIFTALCNALDILTNGKERAQEIAYSTIGKLTKGCECGPKPQAQLIPGSAAVIKFDGIASKSTEFCYRNVIEFNYRRVGWQRPDLGFRGPQYLRRDHAFIWWLLHTNMII